MANHCTYMRFGKGQSSLNDEIYQRVILIGVGVPKRSGHVPIVGTVKRLKTRKCCWAHLLYCSGTGHMLIKNAVSRGTLGKQYYKYTDFFLFNTFQSSIFGLSPARNIVDRVAFILLNWTSLWLYFNALIIYCHVLFTKISHFSRDLS